MSRLRIVARRSRSLMLPAIALLVALRPAPAPAAPGDLDTSFGTGGAALLSVGTAAYANAVAVQGDGDIVAAGYVFTGSSGDMAVVRVDASGALDPGFGSGGVVTLPAGMQSIARAIAIQSDGGILVAGGVFVAPDVLDYDFRVARLLSDGQLDTSFGTGGVVVTPAAGTIGATSLAVQPDGKILVGGDGRRRPRSSNRDFVVCRYLADGSPDTSFGSGGRVTLSMGRRLDVATRLLLQSDGAIVAAGYSASKKTGRIAIARLLASGTLDASFGRAGRQQARLVSRREFVEDAALRPGGQLVAGGQSVNLPDALTSTAMLAQLTSTGTIDASFGTAGVVSTTPFAQAFNDVRRIALQADGKIVGAGSVSGVNDPPDLLLTRFASDGTLDSSFGTGGVVRTLIGTQDEAFAVALQADGAIVVAGVSVVSGQSRLLLERYLP